MRIRALALAAVLGGTLWSGASFATTVTLDTGAATNNKYGFGPAPSFVPTWGESFTAPITGVMTSFTLYLTETGSTGNLVGGINSWSGTASTGNLYTSAPVQTTVTGFPPASAVAYTFSPNISVTAGQTYIAFLSMFGVTGAGGNGQMPFQFTSSAASATGGGGHMYWTSSNPFGASAWTTDPSYPGWVQFQATFSDAAPAPTPLPAALPLFASGAGVIGLFSWRRKRKARAAMAA